MHRLNHWKSYLALFFSLFMLFSFGVNMADAQGGETTGYWINAATIEYGGVSYRASWDTNNLEYLSDSGSSCLVVDNVNKVTGGGMISTNSAGALAFEDNINSGDVPDTAKLGIFQNRDPCSTSGLNRTITLEDVARSEIFFQGWGGTAVVESLSSVFRSGGAYEDELISGSYTRVSDGRYELLSASKYADCYGNSGFIPPTIYRDGDGWKWITSWDNCSDTAEASINSTWFAPSRIGAEPPSSEPEVAIAAPTEAGWKNTATLAIDADLDDNGVNDLFIKSEWDNTKSFVLGTTCAIVFTNGQVNYRPDKLGGTLNYLSGTDIDARLYCTGTAGAIPVTPTAEAFEASGRAGLTVGEWDDPNTSYVKADITIRSSSAVRRFFVTESVTPSVARTIWSTGEDDWGVSRLLGDYDIIGGSASKPVAGCPRATTLKPQGGSEWLWEFTYPDCQIESATVRFDVDLSLYQGTNPPPLEAGSVADNTPTCQTSGGGFGWLICWAVNAMVGVINFFAGIIEYFLKVSPVTSQSESGAPTGIYNAWSNVKNISLVMMIIAGLVAVFGQTFGLEAYTAKKMLPRIVAASIGIMLSFGIVAILVDIFNVLGAGVADLLTGSASITADMASFVGATLISLFGGGVALGGGILWAVGAGSPALPTIGMFVLLPLLFGVISVFLTLIFRQILIILLVVLSPLALLAWTLPNTEKYFKIWFDTLLKALVMYPLIMALIASGQLFAAMITDPEGGAVGVVNLLVAVIAIAVPLFLVPMTFRFAGTAIASVNGGLKALSSKGSEAIKGDARDPNSKRNLLKDQRIENRSHFAGNEKGFKGAMAGLMRSKALGGIQGIGATNRTQVLAEQAGIQRAQQTISDIGASGNAKVLDAMVWKSKDGKRLTGPPVSTGVRDAYGDMIYEDAPEATKQDAATAARLEKDPYMVAEAFAHAASKVVASPDDARALLEQAETAKLDKRDVQGMLKRPLEGKVGMGGVNMGRTLGEEGTPSAGGKKRLVYSWGQVRDRSGNRVAETAEDTAGRQAAANKFIGDTNGLGAYHLGQQHASTFDAMANFVESGADEDFGYDGSGPNAPMQMRIDRLKDVASGRALQFEDADGNTHTGSQATPEAQAAAADALARIQAADIARGGNYVF